MATIHPLFQGLLNAAFPALNNPAPVEAEEEEFIACDSCGAPSTHDVLNSGDPSVGYGSAWVPMCDDCDTRSGRGRSLTCA
jgi:hypothetical protein